MIVRRVSCMMLPFGSQRCALSVCVGSRVFRFNILIDYLLLICSALRVTTINKQHIKDIRINYMLWVECLCVLGVFLLFVVLLLQKK